MTNGKIEDHFDKNIILYMKKLLKSKIYIIYAIVGKICARTEFIWIWRDLWTARQSGTSHKIYLR